MKHVPLLIHGGATARRIALATLTIAAALLPVGAQEYSLFGTLRTEASAGYLNDTYSLVQDRSGSDRFDPDSTAELAATHRFSMAESEFVIDHSVSVESAAEPGSVTLTHDLYQSYLLLMPNPWLNLSFGRQRLNWGAGFTFSSTDALHPRSDDPDTDVGFDGAAVAFLPGPDVSAEFAVALQDATATGDIRDVRTAAYASGYLRTVEIGASFVHQEDTIYRPGVHGSIPVGPVLLFGEAAIEVFGEPGVAEPRLVGNAAAEYTVVADRWDAILVGEYIFNGLADDSLIQPATPRVTDNAGGFPEDSGSAVEYAFVDVTFTVGSDWSTSHSGLVNLEDGSALINHEATLSIYEDTDLGIGVAWTGGDGDTEFGRYPYHVYARAWVEIHF